MCNDQKCKRGYSVMAMDVRESRNVQADKDCAGFIAINKGDTIARINGIPILPAVSAGTSGESFGIDGNEFEYYTGAIQVTFENLQSSPWVVLVQKYYTI